MKSKLSRRDWFKSSMALTAGLTLGPAMVQRLFAASPVSEAERQFWGMKGQPSGKIRLNANENPYGPSERAREAIHQILTEANRYPFQATKDLRDKLAKHEGVDPEYIHIGAGSGDILCQAGVAFGLENGHILSGFPTFPEMMNYAEVFNATWDKVNLTDNLEFDYEALARNVNSKTKLVFICNPNNPTGTLVDPQKVKAFCEDVSKKVPVYSDEAYLEFLPPDQQVSMLPLVKQGLNVVVSRTFSKIYGLAGLRCGYIIARPELVKKIANYQMGIPVSQVALAAASASLGDTEFMKLTRTKNAEARQHLSDHLDKRGIMHGKSHTNFMFFPLEMDGNKLLTEMDKRNIAMRVWDYKDRQWGRVSIGTLDEMKTFTKAFDEVIA